MDFIEAPSQHFDERRDSLAPRYIVLHFTGGKSFEYAFETLKDGRNEKKPGAHYLIHEDGRIFRMIGEEKRAWNAGIGSFDGITDMNSASIAIEISNRDRKPYPPEQLKALVELIHDIQKRYGIPATNIIGHSDYAPERKDDPGYHFPWDALAKEGIGIAPKVKLRDRFRAAATAKNPAKLQKLFTRAGYGPFDVAALTRAFQQHYEPHVYTAPKAGEAPGVATATTVAKLRAVARSRHAPKK